MLAVMMMRMMRTVVRENKVIVWALNIDEVQQQLAKMRDAIVVRRMVKP